jgi:hypothetical protein
LIQGHLPNDFCPQSRDIDAGTFQHPASQSAADAQEARQQHGRGRLCEANTLCQPRRLAVDLAQRVGSVFSLDHALKGVEHRFVINASFSKKIARLAFNDEHGNQVVHRPRRATRGPGDDVGLGADHPHFARKSLSDAPLCHDRHRPQLGPRAAVSSEAPVAARAASGWANPFDWPAAARFCRPKAARGGHREVTAA